MSDFLCYCMINTCNTIVAFVQLIVLMLYFLIISGTYFVFYITHWNIFFAFPNSVVDHRKLRTRGVKKIASGLITQVVHVISQHATDGQLQSFFFSLSYDAVVRLNHRFYAVEASFLWMDDFLGICVALVSRTIYPSVEAK